MGISNQWASDQRPLPTVTELTQLVNVNGDSLMTFQSPTWKPYHRRSWEWNYFNFKTVPVIPSFNQQRYPIIHDVIKYLFLFVLLFMNTRSDVTLKTIYPISPSHSHTSHSSNAHLFSIQLSPIKITSPTPFYMNDTYIRNDPSFTHAITINMNDTYVIKYF